MFMAIKRALLVVEYDDAAGNGYDAVGDIANVFHGCVEDMEGSSFPELSIHGYESVEDMLNDQKRSVGAFKGDGELPPARSPNALTR